MACGGDPAGIVVIQSSDRICWVNLLVAGAGKPARPGNDGNRTWIPVFEFYPQPVHTGACGDGNGLDKPRLSLDICGQRIYPAYFPGDRRGKWSEYVINGGNIGSGELATDTPEGFSSGNGLYHRNLCCTGIDSGAFHPPLCHGGYRVPASTGVPEEAERADSFPLLPTPVASEGEGAANDDGPDDPDDNVVALPWAARRGKNNPHIQRFVSLFNQTAPDANRWQVFSDFVHMAACSLYNAIHRDETFEADYRQRVARYSTEDAHNMSRLLAEVIEGLEFCPTDFLGQIFMNLELGNTRHGQYFTPYNVCYTMSRMTLSDRLSVLTSGERDFITVSDPACGAGGMIVAMAEAMLEAGFNPQKQMMVYCVDIDPVAAMMCYIQLSLMGIPAIVATGNSLTVAIKREMATPMFVLGHWHHRWQAERTRQAA